MKVFLNTIFSILITFGYVSTQTDNWDNYVNISSVCTTTTCYNGYNDTRHSQIVRCRCDRLCKSFGDCCADARAANTSSPAMTYNSMSCRQFQRLTRPIFVKDNSYCPLRSYYSTKCNQSSNASRQIKNYGIKIPVTDISTGVTYGNWQCAACESVIKYAFWNLLVQCVTFNETVTFTSDFPAPTNIFRSRLDLKTKMQFNSSVSRWQTNNGTENCTLSPTPTPQLLPFLRTCDRKTAYISTCPQNGTLTDPQGSKCPGFIAAVRDAKGAVYRNQNCALCNGVNVTALSTLKCGLAPNTVLRFGPAMLRPSNNVTLVFDNQTSTSTSVTKTVSSLVSKKKGTWFVRSSRTTIPLSTASVTKSKSVSPKKPNRRRAFVYVQINQDCSTVLRILNFTKVIAETVYYETWNRTFIKERKLMAGATVQRCRYVEVEEQQLRTIEKDEDSVKRLAETLIVLVAQILLLLHSFEYLATKSETRTISQQCLAGYTFALGLANVGVLFDYYIDGSGVLARDVSFVSHFGFVSTFLWLCSMAFEIPCVFVEEMRNNFRRKADDSSFRRFRVYVILSWGLPAIIVGSRLWYEYSLYNVTLEIKPFVNEDSIVFYTYIFAMCMSVNLAFYLISVYVTSFDPDAGSKLSRQHGVEFQLHTVLLVLTNFMWASVIFSANTMENYSSLIYAVQSLIVATVVYAYSPSENEFSKKVHLFLRQFGYNFNADVGKI